MIVRRYASTRRRRATMTSSEGSPSGEIQKLAEVISDPARRKAFAHDPEKTLTDAGIDVGALPEGVRSTLFDLTHEELRVLSRVKEGLERAGVSTVDVQRIF
jgi:hypothetical protein